MLEKDIEKLSVAFVKKYGGKCRKLDVGQGAKNWLDRLFLMPHGWMFFVEFKQAGKKPRPGQQEMINWLRANGYRVFVIDSVESWQSEVVDWYCRHARLHNSV